MNLDVTISQGRGVITVTGEVDLMTAPRLRKALDQVINDGVVHLVVDISDIGFIDSKGLAVLALALQRLGGQGSLGVVTGTPHVRRVLAVTGLDRVMSVFGSLDAALSGLKVARA